MNLGFLANFREVTSVSYPYKKLVIETSVQTDLPTNLKSFIYTFFAHVFVVKDVKFFIFISI